MPLLIKANQIVRMGEGNNHWLARKFCEKIKNNHPQILPLEILIIQKYVEEGQKFGFENELENFEFCLILIQNPTIVEKPFSTAFRNIIGSSGSNQDKLLLLSKLKLKTL